METSYKLRFIPFILGLIMLAAGLALHFFLKVGEEYNIIRYGAFLTVAGFVFLQAMRQLKREKLEEASPALANIEEQNMPGAQIWNINIKMPCHFLIVRAMLSLILGFLGISLMIDGVLIWGMAVAFAGGGLCLLHIYWVRQNIRELKRLRDKEL